ncbi:MAG: antiterminator LoaP [Oscillospiraceae bacterium]|nr:antiterminator LoaP [Oscillospiraceae bacterium]
MDNWYVMFVAAGKEKSVADGIRAYNAEKEITDVSPFVPTKERFFKTTERVKKERFTMYPGYVFAETAMGAYEFAEYVKGIRRGRAIAMTVLRYGDSEEMALRREERVALASLMNREWCVEASVGFREHDKVRIISGALMGHEAAIKRVDRYKMRAWVELEMFETKMTVEVGLEVLQQSGLHVG